MKSAPHRCYLCQRAVDQRAYCYGCSRHICDYCQWSCVLHMPSGVHSPLEHGRACECGELSIRDQRTIEDRRAAHARK